MKDDAQQALEELEQALLDCEDENPTVDDLLLKADELTGQPEKGADPLDDEELRTLLADKPQAAQEPAFEDPETITDLDKTQAYRNFSNGYGQEQAGISRSDKIDIGLMFGASALALGVIGVLTYWLVAFLAHL